MRRRSPPLERRVKHCSTPNERMNLRKIIEQCRKRKKQKKKSKNQSANEPQYLRKIIEQCRKYKKQKKKSKNQSMIVDFLRA